MSAALSAREDRNTSRELPKAATGISGLDEITGGGLPRGRPTLVCGSAGCGKTLLSMEFLVRGATEFGEPGVFIAFEESEQELTDNVRSLGFDVDDLVARNMLSVDYIHIEPSEIHETGDYDLEGLFLRLGLAIDSVGAKRVVIDTIETLFGGLKNASVLRSELRRLFRWLKDRGVTVIITGERGDGALTRQGLEEYVADCVILLDHRVNEQQSTRRLRVVKYRGSIHGTNEYPFLIDEHGISVLPVTTMLMPQSISNERISTGVPRLDAMLGGAGYFRGSSAMVTGTAGTGKSTLAASLANATCQRGERVLYFAFEESERQIVRNMGSVGIDLQPWIDGGLLKIHASRPALHGLEAHLVVIHKLVQSFDPSVVVIDPVSNFTNSSGRQDVSAMLVRLIDFLKSRGVTAFFTTLTSGGAATEHTQLEISSLIDTWLLLRSIEVGGERNRALYVLKSRGMNHSNQIREFLVTSSGIDLVDVYVGQGGVLTGAARVAQEARERAEQLAHDDDAGRRLRELTRRRAALEAQIVALRTEFDATAEEASRLQSQDQTRQSSAAAERAAMSRHRGADLTPHGTHQSLDVTQ